MAARWWILTNAIIAAVAAKDEPVAYLLWGEHAKAKCRLIDPQRHVVVLSSHPSPLSRTGFLRSKPFSRVNEALAQRGAALIDWSLDA